MSHAKPTSRVRRRRHAGLSLVELLVAMTISVMLLTATMVAIDASFKAYAASAEQASAQSSTRIATSRLLSMLRNSTAQGPLVPDGSATPPVTLSGDTITSNYIELQDQYGNIVRMEYRATPQELWVIKTTPAGVKTSQPIVGGVTACTFSCVRRQDDHGLWVLSRGTMDLTVMPGADATLGLEAQRAQAIRVIGSTMPRKLQ